MDIKVNQNPTTQKHQIESIKKKINRKKLRDFLIFNLTKKELKYEYS